MCMKMANLTTLEWNQLLRRERLPLILVTSFLFAIGFTGNFAVVLVYRTRLKITDGRFFIPFLAIADLCATTVTSSFVLLMDYTEALFPSDQLCKVLQFLNWSTSQCSIFLLFVIAVHRYFSVCRPLDMRFTRTWQKVAVVASLILAYSFGLPLLFFSGRVTLNVNYKGSNVTGHVCTFNPGNVKLGEVIYYRMLFIGNISLLFVMTALYVPIGKVIYRRLKKQKQSSSNGTASRVKETSQTAESTESINLSIELTDDSVPVPDDKNLKLNFQQNNLTSEKKSTISIISKAFQKRASAYKKSTKTKNGKGGNQASKFTLTIMLVVLFYIASYIPFYVIVSTGINDPNEWFNLPPWKLNGNLFLYRCYIINNVVNPIIYGLFDSTFRKQLLGLCSSEVEVKKK